MLGLATIPNAPSDDQIVKVHTLSLVLPATDEPFDPKKFLYLIAGFLPGQAHSPILSI